ncbi:MAG: glycosyl hydrolase [Cytophagales bacterium]|nr:glycosyl hydrolase [Cytophagales bacterium]
MKRRDFIKSTTAAGMMTVITPTCIIQSCSQYEESKLQNSFLFPKGSAKPATMWFWMNGQVTKEGITLDLEAMARAGIGAVFNFDAGTGIPEGPLKYLSDEWFDVKSHAMQEADRLGIEYVMHNCPGWSSSGGPWITPELSMKKLTWSETHILGGQKIKMHLAQPFSKLNFYKDITVLAYPSLPGEEPLKTLVKSIKTNNGPIDIKLLLDNNNEGVLLKPLKGKKESLTFEFNNTYAAKSLSFVFESKEEFQTTPIILEASNDGVNFKQISSIAIGRGFSETGGIEFITADFEATNSKFFRISCEQACKLSQIGFSGVRHFSEWEKKANHYFNKYGTEPIKDENQLAIDPNTIIDLSKNMTEDGVLNWEAPAGNWTILRFGYTSLGTTNRSAPDTGFGLECDKYDARAIEFHFNKMMTDLLPMIDPLAQKGKMGLEIDSWEVGMQNWTGGFEQEFHNRNGYELIEYLPTMTGRLVDSADNTERFLWDLRRTQADLLADNYYGKFDELCNSHDIKSYIEPYDRGPMEELQIGARADGVMGEYWNSLSTIFQNNKTMRRTCKLASSIAHISGQKVVGVEGLTGEPSSAKWQEYAFAMKPICDKVFTMGINRIVVHRYAHQPHPTAVPGMTMGPWGIQFDRTNTLWEVNKAWLTYLSRAQSMLQQGLFVADFAYFTGEDPGVYTSVNKADLSPSPLEGYDYDVINAEILIRNAKVINKRLVLPDGMSYTILVLQEYRSISLELLKTLRGFIQQGLIVIGAKPKTTPGLKTHSLASKKEFEIITKELWGDNQNIVDNKVGKGRLFWGQSLKDILAILNLTPDFIATSASGDYPVKYIHRKTDNEDFYFISNQRRTYEELVCSFRITGRKPEFWDPNTGKIWNAVVYEEVGGHTNVSVNLPPYGAIFVVFKKEKITTAITSISKNNETVITATPFKLQNRKLYTNITNNFTISFWAKPELEIMLTENGYYEGVKGSWTDFYSIYPIPGEKHYGKNHATCGVTVGRNGIAVWENSDGWPLFNVSAKVAVSGWNLVTIRYQNGVPSIFLNGEFLIEGKTNYSHIHPSIGEAFLSEGASYYNGDMTTPLLIENALNPNEIKAAFDKAEFKNTTPKTPIVEVLNNNLPSLLFKENGAYSLNQQNGEIETVKISGIPKSQKVNGSWNVSFPAERGAPEMITLSSLQSLNKHTNEGVKYFSGTCSYKTEFQINEEVDTEEDKLFLDLGRVEVIAEVILNGKNLGIYWTRPYRIDITEAVHTGNNMLEVKITNQWVNRLIGDEQMPEVDEYSIEGEGTLFEALSVGAIKELPEWYQKGEPKPKNGRVAFTTWKHFQKDSPLLESGLIGPVMIEKNKFKLL